ncbi:MAG: tRNA (adenosine(37)-N6)-threonylcarbamoyltransferase complex ATPase subunit type 1 TsaE [Egibacteraceae bacterium]
MKRAVTCTTEGPEETRQLAAVVAGALRPGDLVALTGELGAGKTCFVQGAAKALGVTQRVTSPSFLLRRDYEGDVIVQHLDVYRLDTLQEVIELGFGEATEPGHRRVTFIEWGDAMAPLLPVAYLEVEISLTDVRASTGAADDGFRRSVIVRPHGDDWLRRIVGLAVDLQPWRKGIEGLPDPGRGSATAGGEEG